MNTHFSSNAPHEFSTIEFAGKTECGQVRVFATSNPRVADCPACQDRLAAIASRAKVYAQSTERDGWEALDNSRRPHVLHSEVKGVHRGAFTPSVSADVVGTLWEREDERSATMLGHFSYPSGAESDLHRGPRLNDIRQRLYGSGMIRSGSSGL